MAIQFDNSATGTVTLKSPSSGTPSFTLPSADGTSGQLLQTNGAGVLSFATVPAFRAYSGTDQTVSNGVSTKVQLNTEVFDTNNNFDSTTNYRFTPTVAGYYQFSAAVYSTDSGTMSYNYIKIFKNGGQDSAVIYGPYGSSAQAGSLSALIYLNGTTDYVELYIEVAGSGTLTAKAGASLTYLSGFLARAG